MNTKSKSPSFLVRAIAAILGVIIGNVIMSILFGDSIVQPTYFPELASQNPNPGLLMGGMALMGILIAALFPSFRIETGAGWFGSTIKFALLFGLTVSFATNIFQAGFINVSAMGWMLEGLYDSTGPALAVIVLAWLTHRHDKA